jgi:hypothetical protein
VVSNPDDPIGVIPDISKEWQDGLTKREYFAALAMQGLIAADLDWGDEPMDELAPLAVQYADALIHQLNKRKVAG